MKLAKFSHRFVEHIPTSMDDGVLYVSMEYATAIHKCACGCGSEVVTAISPTDWEMTFDGDSITLEPSIGNWNFPCRSHYYIRRGVVRWAGDMSTHHIEQGRSRDRAKKAEYFQTTKQPVSEKSLEDVPLPPAQEKSSKGTVAVSATGFWRSLANWFRT